MKEFSLGLDASINGIYLNSETIELLSIIQCESVKDLQEYARNCSQLDIPEESIANWNEQNIENIKRDLFEKYKESIIPLKQSIEDRNSVLESALQHSGIPEGEIDEYISISKDKKYAEIKEQLLEKYPEKYVNSIIKNMVNDEIRQKVLEEHRDEYSEFAEKQHRFIASERDQMTEVSYEEISAINDSLKNHNTILVASGRYYDVTNKSYNENVPNMQKYDFYYAQRGLDFCYKNGMNARYHTLLDKQTMEEHLIGKSKEEVISELEAYVEKSVDFISEYNQTHQIDGKGVISSVDLFNEIISFDEPYKNMWKELYGISNEDLVDIFQHAQDKKPDGVTYVYNEPFLENPERRKAVLEQLQQMNELSPGLIDTIGTQMHIEMTQDIESIRQCFEDLKHLQEEYGIKVQITEFDMCLPERYMFDEKGRIRSEDELVQIINSKLGKSGITIGSIADFKSMRMQEIAQIIKETGIDLEGITYWATSDTLDANTQRTNEKTYGKDGKGGINREIAHTRYGGAYSYAEVEQEKGKSILLESAIEATETSTRTEKVNEQVIAIRKEIEQERMQENALDENDDNENR